MNRSGEAQCGALGLVQPVWPRNRALGWGLNSPDSTHSTHPEKAGLASLRVFHYSERGEENKVGRLNELYTIKRDNCREEKRLKQRGVSKFESTKSLS